MTADFASAEGLSGSNESGSESQPYTAWWGELSKVALFGTDRRNPPQPPAAVPTRSDNSPETAVLDAAALGGALLRTATRPAVDGDPQFVPAEADRRLEPSDRARQLLELIMAQSPAGQRLQPLLLSCWLQSADRSGHRIPHRWLPDVLNLVSRGQGPDDELRAMIRTVADERGRWIANLHPAWAWLKPEQPVSTDPNEWARSSTAARGKTARTLRASEPDRARQLISSTLSTDGAQDRATLLGCLEIGLGLADESLLEQGLDDRSGVVRAACADLLNGLAGSSRAHRMARTLRPLLSVHGMFDRSLAIGLPTTPDPAGVRDGLGAPPLRRSERGYWLERLAAGAPLAVWTDVTGKDPRRTWPLITDEDARSGIVTAIIARHDHQWAEVVAADPTVWQSRPAAFLQLLQVLPPNSWEDVATERMSELTAGSSVVRLIRGAPIPWSARFSLATLNALDRVNQPLGDVVDVLATALHPSALDRLQELATGQGSVANREGARNLTQYLTLRTEIAEAFR